MAFRLGIKERTSIPISHVEDPRIIDVTIVILNTTGEIPTKMEGIQAKVLKQPPSLLQHV